MKKLLFAVLLLSSFSLFATEKCFYSSVNGGQSSYVFLTKNRTTQDTYLVNGYVKTQGLFFPVSGSALFADNQFLFTVSANYFGLLGLQQLNQVWVTDKNFSNGWLFNNSNQFQLVPVNCK